MSPQAPPRALLRMLSDERLARLAAGGSETAFDVIHDRHAGALAACCRAIVRNEDDARDALQNTLLKAWCAIGRRGDAPVRAWMLRIARNESIAMLRRRRAISQLRDELPDHRQDLHESTARRAELARVLDGLDDLSARQRQALVLRTLGGVGYAEIARIQDTSQDAVRQSVAVARRSLRRGRLAGLAPVPAWLAELMAATGGGGATMPGSVGRVAVAVTATIAAAGSLGTTVPHVRHRHETASAAAPARTHPASERAAGASTPARAPARARLPAVRQRLRLVQRAPAPGGSGAAALRLATGDVPPPRHARPQGVELRAATPSSPGGEGRGGDGAVRVDAASRPSFAAPRTPLSQDGQRPAVAGGQAPQGAGLGDVPAEGAQQAASRDGASGAAGPSPPSSTGA